jgi:acyl carrier protein
MTTTTETFSKIADIVHEVAGVAADTVRPEQRFIEDLGVDSLTMLEIVYGVEDAFSISIPEEETPNLLTVGDAVAYVDRATA